jgi:hypothetical protein
MKKIVILAVMAIAASCTPAKQTEAVDSAAVVVDTLAVQPGVEVAVPTDTVK